MNKRDEVALAIFIKRLPNEPLLDNNRPWFVSRAVEAYQLADLFLLSQKQPADLPDAPTSSGLEVEK